MAAVEQREDGRERVVGRHTTGEREGPPQPVESGVPEGLDGDEVVGARDGSAKSEREEVRERVALTVIPSRIGDGVEVAAES